MDLFKCTRRIIYFSLTLTLLIALNYLFNTNLINFSPIKSLVHKIQTNNGNVAFDIRITTPRPISIKQTDLNKTKRPRKQRERPKSFFRTREEVESTRTFNIQPQLCVGNSTGISIFVMTKADGLPRRQMLRSTWVKYARQKGICVYFLIGLDKSQQVQEEIHVEAIEHQDLIQGNFIEYYYNLTLKSISMLRWANTNCKQDHFIIKVDDDIVFQIDWFLEKRDEIKNGIYGDKRYMGITNRYSSDKNWVPAKYYREQRKINYVSGGLYLITVNVLDAFVKGVDSFQGYFINTEDVFITGMIAEKADISRNRLFISKWKCLRCALFRFIVSWSCSIDDLKRRWDEFENKKRFRC